MSFKEKDNQNRFRFSKEITLGDALLIVGVIVMCANLKFKVDDHEKRIAADEAIIAAHDKQISNHDTMIAVIRGKIYGQ